MGRPGIQVDEDDDTGIASLSPPSRGYSEQPSNTTNTQTTVINDRNERGADEDDVSAAKPTSAKGTSSGSVKGKPDDGDDVSTPPARKLYKGDGDSSPPAEVAAASSGTESNAVVVATSNKAMEGKEDGLSMHQETSPRNLMDEKKISKPPMGFTVIQPGAIPVPTTQMSGRKGKDGQSNTKLTLMAGSSPAQRRKNAPSYISSNDESNVDSTAENNSHVAGDQTVDTDAFDSMAPQTGNEANVESQQQNEPVSHEDNIVELVANRIRDRLFHNNIDVQNAEVVNANVNTDVENGQLCDADSIGSEKADVPSSRCNNCWKIVACLVLVGGIIGAVLGVVLPGGGGDSQERLTTQPPTGAPSTIAPSFRAPTASPIFGVEARRESLLAILASSFGVVETSEEWREDFDDPNNPQAKALAWMSEKDQTTANLLQQQSVEATLVDRYATVLVYFSMSGPDWSIDFPFLNGATSICAWNNGNSGFLEKQGIYCADATNYGVVTEVWLQSLDLTGTIAWEPFSFLHQLTALYMYENLLTGSLPEELSNLSNLRALGISSNALTGHLPLSVPPELQFLNLESNELSGTLPSDWDSNMPSLTELSLANNHLSGAIPWDDFSSLKKLDLKFNFLTGPLPSEMPESLELLTLYNNSLSGTLPTEWSTVLTSLTYLNLAANQLEGTIPWEPFSAWGQLSTLYMFENMLTGSVPTQVGNLSSLKVFALYSNLLTGSLPSEMPEGLVLLDLSNNAFTGTLPTEWSTVLTSLTYLNLGVNQIQGTIPWEPFSAWGQLSALYMFENLLTGSLPTELSNLSNLRALGISSNALTGHLPLSVPPELLFLNLGNNHLSGTIQWDDFSSLKNLALDSNFLTGPLPSELPEGLEYLNLHNNAFNGTLPTEWSTVLTSLTYLNLGVNQIQGTIPWEPFSAWGQLSTLYMYENLLTGSLPEELSNLSNLRALGISSNSLTGHMPLSVPPELQFLNIESNALSGTLPSNWASTMRSLTVLNLGNNLLSGTIPWDDLFGLASRFDSLYLHGNMFTGGLAPTQLGSFSKLKNLALDSNFLTGHLPSEMPEGLEFLNLYNNALSGTLPLEWSTVLTSLTFLNLGVNQLEGTIPWEPFSAWGQLTTLYVYNNTLTGPMPTHLDNLSSLRFLAFASNSLTGTLSSSNSMPETLEELWLFEMDLSGTIPDAWANGMPSLSILDLGINAFVGTIPTTLGTLTDLTQLYLNTNALTGTLPTQLGYLSRLEVLYVQSNPLTGTVPNEYSNLSLLTSLSLEDTDLTGSVDAIFCTWDEPPMDMWADCLGENPIMECTCCSWCCSDDGTECIEM